MERSTSYDSYIHIMSRLDQHVMELREMAQRLMPLTFPKVHFREEQEILPLKQQPIIVDGYETMICYSEADYGQYILKSVQVQSSQVPFLPFTVVCKIGKAFLGSENLSYIEFFRNSRKIYCWTVKSKNGSVLPPDVKTKPGQYEGFKFRILQNGSVDLI